MAELLDNCLFTAGSMGTADFADGAADPTCRNLEDAGAEDGAVYPYKARNATGTEWEIGRGTVVVSEGTWTLERTTIQDSSDGGNKINFGTHPKIIITAGKVEIGDVKGPESATDGAIAVFDGATGKLLKDGGKAIESLLPRDGSAAMTGPLVLTEDDAPATPDAGQVALYAKSDGKLYRKDDTGAEEEVGAGSGDVVGPAASTNNSVAIFNGVSGKLLKDGGVDVADIYRRSNIVGIVSQSGGVPTEAVIERGSNANGEYTRWADGTQECWLSSVTLTQANSSSMTYGWTLPAAFAGDTFADIIISNSTASYSNLVRTAVGAAWSTIGSITIHCGVYRVEGAASLASNAKITDCRVRAIGRWF